MSNYEHLLKLDADAAAVIARYPQSGSALLPLLHLVQSEEGYVSPAGIEYCADKLGLSTAEVSAVSTFYTMYKRRPVGDYHVGVCTNTLCAVMGGDAIFATLKEHLGVGNDETTEDGKRHAGAHRVQRGLRLRPGDDGQLGVPGRHDPGQGGRGSVDELRAGKEVHSTRGPALCTFKQAERILAGFEDPRPGAVAGGGAAGHATLAGLLVSQGRTPTGPAVTTEASE